MERSARERGGDSVSPVLTSESEQVTAMRRTLSLLLSVALWAVPVGIAGAQDSTSSETDTLERSRPDFQLLRQVENGRRWAGDADGLASLTFIPLGRDGGTFLTIGGEARAYGRWYRNERWGDGPASDAYLLQRLMLHGSAQTDLPPDWARIRVFAQLKSGTVTGRDGPIYPPDKDLLDVNQAFLEMQGRLGSAQRLGRQELHYGAGRMIAAREGPNVRLGFDAALGRYRNGPWRVDAFAAKPNETSPDVLDNGWMTGRTLWGLHLSRRAGRRDCRSTTLAPTGVRPPQPEGSKRPVTRLGDAFTERAAPWPTTWKGPFSSVAIAALRPRRLRRWSNAVASML